MLKLSLQRTKSQFFNPCQLHVLIKNVQSFTQIHLHNTGWKGAYNIFQKKGKFLADAMLLGTGQLIVYTIPNLTIGQVRVAKEMHCHKFDKSLQEFIDCLSISLLSP